MVRHRALSAAAHARRPLVLAFFFFWGGLGVSKRMRALGPILGLGFRDYKAEGLGMRV